MDDSPADQPVDSDRPTSADRATDALSLAASAGLPGTRSTIEVPVDVDTDTLVGLAITEGLLGPLLAALPEEAEDLRDRVLAAHGSAMAWCLMLEQRLLDIDDWYSDSGGIPYLVLKGPAVAHLDEADPSMRSFADVDLLIPAPHMDRALMVLADHGVQRRIPEHHKGFDRRFTKGVGLTCDDGIEIDVHRTLCLGALGERIPLNDLFAQPDTFDLGGRRIGALSLAHRALHSAYHAVVGTSARQLRTLRDVAGYLTRIGPEALVPVARRWRGETVLHAAVSATFDALSFSAPSWSEWVAAFEPNVGDLELIEASLHESPAPFDLQFLRELGWRDRFAYLWGVTMPSAETLQSRGQTHWSRIRDGVTQLRANR